MPVEQVWTVSADGFEPDGVTPTDYTHPQTWFDTEGYDLVAADEIAVLEFFGHATGVWTDGGFLAASDGLGWATDATHFIHLRMAAGQGHDGTPPANPSYTITGNAAWIAVNASLRILVDGLSFRCNGASANFSAGFRAQNGADLWVDRCVLAWDAHGGSGSYSFQITNLSGSRSSSMHVRNCISIDNAGGLDRHVGVDNSFAGRERWFLNNTFIGGDLGLSDNGNTLTAREVIRNNIVQGATTCYDLDGAFGSGGNISSDATSPDGAGFQGVSLTFADAADDDYHLAAGDADAIGAGLNLEADFLAWPHDVFLGRTAGVDLDLDARPASPTAWDVGADQAAGAGDSPILFSGGVSGAAVVAAAFARDQLFAGAVAGAALPAAAIAREHLIAGAVAAGATPAASFDRDYFLAGDIVANAVIEGSMTLEGLPTTLAAFVRQRIAITLGL